MNFYYAGALNKAMGFIVAIWLFLAVCSDGNGPLISMVGALVSVCIWAGIAYTFNRADQ